MAVLGYHGFGWGFAVWIFSLFLLAMGWSFVKKAKQRIKERALVYFGADEMDAMTGSEFETFLASVFKELGYDVSATPATGDYGADLLLVKDGTKIAVQTKRHSKNIGNKAVQEVYAGMAHYGADEGWVVKLLFYKLRNCAGKRHRHKVGRQERSDRIHCSGKGHD